ncbi:MAG: hypothetical protein ACRDI2_16615, partial [Chloroflexota bacterium]
MPRVARTSTFHARRTRRAILAGSTVGAAAALAACAPGASPGSDGGAAQIAGPKEITWSSYQLGESR